MVYTDIMLSLNNNKNYGRSTGRVKGNHPFLHGPMSFTGFIIQIYIFFLMTLFQYKIIKHEESRYIILPIDNIITVISFINLIICINALGDRSLFYSIFIDLMFLYEFIGNSDFLIY